MAIVVHIPGQLRSLTDGRARVDLEGAPRNVDEALASLWSTYPGIRDRLVTERGEIRRHVNVFVGSESIRYTGGTGTALEDGCEIFIVPAVSGG